MLQGTHMLWIQGERSGGETSSRCTLSRWPMNKCGEAMGVLGRAGGSLKQGLAVATCAFHGEAQLLEGYLPCTLPLTPSLDSPFLISFPVPALAPLPLPSL